MPTTGTPDTTVRFAAKDAAARVAARQCARRDTR